jgi:hypothetical protein
MAADITYTTDGGNTVFSADTPAGEEFLDGRELAVPNEDAKEYLDRANAAGLMVVPFPD